MPAQPCMIRLSLASTALGFCCDLLRVRGSVLPDPHIVDHHVGRNDGGLRVVGADAVIEDQVHRGGGDSGGDLAYLLAVVEVGDRALLPFGTFILDRSLRKQESLLLQQKAVR